MLTDGSCHVNIIPREAAALICLFGFEEECVRPFGQRRGDDDAEGMLGEEDGHASDVCAERGECGGYLLVSEFSCVEGFGGTAESATQAVKGEVAFGKDFAALLKVAERVKEYALGVLLARLTLTVEKCWLAHH
ncbi:MAG: hypothetical protein QOE46_695 [Acidobacteriota bacterium]|jgi:hypothetical protein|nr:hypothetical protein [Acidobacteriota bacterium]